jgi:hypothetical protein
VGFGGAKSRQAGRRNFTVRHSRPTIAELDLVMDVRRGSFSERYIEVNPSFLRCVAAVLELPRGVWSSGLLVRIGVEMG